MRSKKLFKLLTLNLIFVPTILLGQYVYNPKMVYPINASLNAASNFTLTKTHNGGGYLMVPNASLSNNMAGFAIEIDNMLNYTWHVSGIPVLSSDYFKLQTKDVISCSDGSYIGCGILAFKDREYAFIAKGRRDTLPYFWAKIYPSATLFQSIVEIESNADIVERFIVCGQYSEPDYANGVLMCIDENGNPLWQKNTLSNGKSDRFCYNQVIQLKSIVSPSIGPFFAAVGNALTYPDLNRDVLMTLFNFKGAVNYNYMYGHQNNEKLNYIEQGYGIAQLPDSTQVAPKLVISGRTRCAYQMIPEVLWEDVLLFSIDVWTGKIVWQNRYDVLGDNKSGEFGQKVLIRREINSFEPFCYVTGYQRGDIMNPDGSIDAFIMKTRINGFPVENRIMGHYGNDYLYQLMNNNKNDGIIAAGYSNSFGDESGVSPNYSPFVVESYLHFLRPCYDVVLDLPSAQLKMDINKIESKEVIPEVKRIPVERYQLRVGQIVICPKIPILDSLIFDNKKLTEIDPLDNDDNEFIVYPTLITDFIRVEGIKDNSNYSIYNMSGEEILNGIINNGNEIDVSNLNKGIYILKVIKNETIKTKKLIK